MTREEAKKLYTPKSTYLMKMKFVDKIFDDFEAEIKQLKKKLIGTIIESEAKMVKMEKEFNEELEYIKRLEKQQKALCNYAAKVSKNIKEGK